MSKILMLLSMGEMDNWVKELVLGTNLDPMDSLFRIYVTEGKTKLLQTVL